MFLVLCHAEAKWNPDAFALGIVCMLSYPGEDQKKQDLRVGKFSDFPIWAAQQANPVGLDISLKRITNSDSYQSQLELQS